MLSARKLIESVNTSATLTQEELFPLFSQASFLVNDCIRLLMHENVYIQSRTIELGAEVAANLDRNKAIYRRSVAFVDDQLKDVVADNELREDSFLCACMDLQLSLMKDDRPRQLKLVLGLPLTRMIFERFVKDWISGAKGYVDASLRSLSAYTRGDFVLSSSIDADCHQIEKECFLDPRTAFGVVRYTSVRFLALGKIYDRIFRAYSRVILKLAKTQSVSEDHSLDCLSGDSLVWTDKGLLRIDSLEPCTVQGTKGRYESYPHFPGDKVRDVVTAESRLGLKTTGTPDHKIKVFNEDTQGVEWSTLEDSVGRYALVSVGSGLSWPIDVSVDIDLANDGLKRNAIVPSGLTPGISSILGYLVSEGTVYGPGSSNKGSVGFANMDRDLLDHYSSLSASEFGVITSAYLKKNGVTELTYLDHNANDVLRYLGCLYVPSEDKEVPWSVLRGSKESVVSFIRAYWEGDGSLVERPSCGSKSEKLITGIQQLLLRLGIVSKKSRSTRSTDYYGAPTDTELVMHILTITAAQDARKFVEVIGYTSSVSNVEVDSWGRKPSASTRILKLTSSQVNDIWQLVDDGASYASLGKRFGVTPEYISSISNNRQTYRGDDYTPSTGYSMRRCKRNLVPGATPRSTSSKVNRHAYLCDLDRGHILHSLDGDYILDRIDSVKKSGSCRVYDISVDSIHEFVCNGNIYSNCFQNGSFGLLRAVSSYDHVSNARFVGHARWWIRQSMLLYLKEDSNIIKVSSNTWQHYAKLEDVRKKHESIHGPMDNDSLSKVSGYSKSHVDSIYSMVRASQVRSLDYPMRPDGSTTLVNFVDTSTNSTEPSGYSTADSVKVLLGNLPDALRNMVCLNFGLTEYVVQELDPAQVEAERKRQSLHT